MITTLYWMTHDLRLDDNPALVRAAWSNRLLCVFCVDPRWFSAHRYHVSSMGDHRWQFLQQSLDNLNQQLKPLKQHVLIEFGYPEQQLAALVVKHGITRLVCSRQFGSDERAVLDSLAKRLPALKIEEVDTYTLFDLKDLPVGLEETRSSFSGFRRKAEQYPVPMPLEAPHTLPASLVDPAQSSFPDKLPEWAPASANDASLFGGGETTAKIHLKKYFSGDLPRHYKDVRNELDGWENSSKMSAWLNQGCLSARRLKLTLDQYETNHGANESTQWLFVELLWREYFQWLALEIGKQLYRFKGMAGRCPLTCVHPERYQKWCNGTTPFPLVNACMRQLKQTGYLSNRGRQIAASCFVNELGLDWRYGAAWFEHQLIDYDVAVNWGNWQYIAGVGVDPRGGRHFDLDKQTELYDADGSYRARWAPGVTDSVLDSVDAADWPIA
ncbi:MAG: DASH family cryptochrome [Pseudohongiella sp.]|nr:DASH family cryptochrome [Pseudohongiella sp.]MDP2128907.1 DASH family cryptochrome [Pseudohongiella sp.]